MMVMMVFIEFLISGDLIFLPHMSPFRRPPTEEKYADVRFMPYAPGHAGLHRGGTT